jgi:bifunctional non-homologous end joining protein LigD
MSLTEYRRKRHFGKTAEPEPGKALPPGKRAIFVVQLHHASRRHYDFRLQVGDTLKSWAVPKGPSYDPSVKRMAVEVEDHPVDYATFEGEIPKGEYGGGHVAVFDNGVWSTQGNAEDQLAKGHLRFELYGKKLRGGWHLVRSGKPAKQPQWLLFKDKDAYAGKLEADDLLGDITPPPAADVQRAGGGKADKKGKTVVAPQRTGRRVDWAKRAAALTGARKVMLRNEAFEPQLAKLGDKPPEGAQWLHEIKWDGYRLVTTIVGGKVRIWSRNAIEWTDKVPEIRAAIERLGLSDAALDGELIAGRGTQADFNLLQATLSGEQQGALTYVLFDLLHCAGYAIESAPLHERKALLAQILAKPVPRLALSSHIQSDGPEAYRLASEGEFEGIISKRADAAYRGGRGDDWRKTKKLDSDEFAVVGYTRPKGSRTGFGSLLLARPAEGGWRYVGRVGSGFNDAQLRELTARIDKAGTPTPTATVTPAVARELREALWFPPLFVAEVFMRGIGSSGLLRQPSLKAIRLDKRVGDLGDSDRTPAAKTKARAGSKASVKTSASAKAKTKNVSTEPVRLSSPTKVIFPDKGYTKQQVFDYYTAVMDHLLPEIVGRPLSVIRCPSGAGAACFFQKHHTPGLKRVDLVRLKEETGVNANYLVVRDAQGVLELVQFNALEFHPWGSTAEQPGVANRVVFDLDPGGDVPFAQVKQAAVHVRDLLKKIELQSFLRTSGGKGLHVVVPLNPGCEWDLVKRFARGFAEALATSEPDRFLAVSSLKLRPKKIFVDYLRNGRGATAVASYSLRARDGAPVALPLAWSELAALKHANAFTMLEVPQRLKRRRIDPWAGIDAVEQNLARWAHK